MGLLPLALCLRASPRRILRIVIVHPPIKYIVAIPFIIGAALTFTASQHAKEVVSRQAVVVGQIIDHEPSNHNRYGYRFQVGGKEYTGSESPSREAPKIGQSVTVYYDSHDPNESALTNYAEHGDTEFAQAWGILFFAALVWFVIYAVERLSHRHNSQY